MALLLITILFAAAVFLIKYKLEGLRAIVEHEVEVRTGARLRVGAVLVNGLRGLRVDQADITFDSGSGPILEVQIPIAYVYLDIADLLYGEITLDRVIADNAGIRCSRPAARPWLPGGKSVGSSGFSLQLDRLKPELQTPAFRVLGKNCSLTIENLVADADVPVTSLDFDVSRLSGSPDFVAKCSGNLAPDKPFKIDLRFTSIEDFDLRLQGHAITVEDLATVLPASRQFLQSGSVSPSLRIAGYPNSTLIVAFEAPFEDLAVNGQPDFIAPAEGTITGVAQYDIARRLLTLTTAKAESEEVGGKVDGSISFARDYPEFDLQFDVTHLPLEDALDYSIAGRADQYGALHLTLEEPYQLRAELQGASASPVISVNGSAPSGQVSFKPKDASLPTAELSLGPMSLSWDSQAPGPVGSFVIANGTLKHEPTGLKAQKVTGTLSLADKKIAVDPINAELTGNPFVGALKYDLATGQLETAGSGTFAGLDKIALPGLAKALSLAGAVNFHYGLTRNKNKWSLDADIDATQTEIGYQWWFFKPAGIGAIFKKVHADIAPASIALTANGAVASSNLGVKAHLSYNTRRKKWLLEKVDGTADKLDVSAVGKCLKVPYKITGGTGRAGTFSWARDKGLQPLVHSTDANNWTLTAAADIDDIALTPDGGEVPMHCLGVHAETRLENAPKQTGTLVLTVDKGVMPPIRTPWFAPVKLDPKIRELYPADERDWNFDLKAKAVEVPPWKGSRFEGQAFFTQADAGLSAFKAEIDGGGFVMGKYQRFKKDNKYETTLDWHEIAAHYLLDQLRYPPVLTGTTSGRFQYAMNREEPKSIVGHGDVEVTDGRFSADYLVSQLEGQLKKEQITSLPLSLKFNRLKTDLELDHEAIRTANMELDSEGIKVTGGGSFVVEGDMDYDLKMTLNPDLAEKVPALRDNLNLNGLRIAQQDIELAFKIKGPSLNPQGELTQAPSVGVTIVSSALEIGNDAIKVIDIPRKVLIDLIRIGGGLVGISK